jgi:hypothetical protein
MTAQLAPPLHEHTMRNPPLMLAQYATAEKHGFRDNVFIAD